MNFDNRPIGVFDSGIGGLTVLRHLLQTMPDERFVYLGDTARVPYGNKSAETIAQYSRQCAAFLLQHDVKLIVVACNTASAMALDLLQHEVAVPVVGVIEPAAAEAVRRTRNGSVGVIGTRATITSNSYATAIARQPGGDHVLVHSQPCPLFVPLVEEGWLHHPATRLVAEDYLRPLIANGIDTLVLGCTHYPMLAPLLRSILAPVTLVDCGACTAEAARTILQAHGTMAAPGSRQEAFYYLTDHTPTFTTLAREFLGVPSVNDPVRVSVDRAPLGTAPSKELP